MTEHGYKSLIKGLCDMLITTLPKKETSFIIGELLENGEIEVETEFSPEEIVFTNIKNGNMIRFSHHIPHPRDIDKLFQGNNRGILIGLN